MLRFCPIRLICLMCPIPLSPIPLSLSLPSRLVCHYRPPVRWNVILIPMLLVLGGVVTAVMVPLEPRLRALIVAADVFAAVAVGLILLRAGGRR